MKNKYKLFLVLTSTLIIVFSACKNDTTTNENNANISMDNNQSSESIAHDKEITQDHEKTKEDIIAKYKADGLVFNINYTAITKYPESLENEEFIVPDFITIIGSESFKGNKYLKKVVLPETIKEIEWSAFQESCIEEINIPDSLDAIGDFAFCKCPNLTTVHASEEMIEKILGGRFSFMHTPFAENYAKKKFIESGKQAELDTYSTKIPYDTSIQYKTNQSSNMVNGGQIIDVNDYIYYTNGRLLNRIDKQGNKSELIFESIVLKLYLYNDEIYYSGYDKDNDMYGIFQLNKITFENNLILEGYTDSFVIYNDIIFYTNYTDTNTNELYLYSYNMNTKENIFIDRNLAAVRDRDNIVIYNDKIIYALSDNNYGEILMQYDISKAKSCELENKSTLFNLRGGFTSAKMQMYNNKLFATFNGAVYKATIDKGINWEQIIPRLDDEGYIYQLCVTDNYIFFFTNQFMLSNDVHYYHIFRMKHDGSEITNIYDSEEENTDGGSTGIYARMYIAEDRIFLFKFGHQAIVLDFNGNVLDWNISTNKYIKYHSI